MDSADISDFNIPASGSRLLSESSLALGSSSSSAHTGPGGDDLSISELSLGERPMPGRTRERAFSLLARPLAHGNESALEDEDADALEQTMTQEEIEKARKEAARTREEKLQHDLFVLKKLNAAFEVYKDALKETKSSTERVALQLEHTNALLDKYVRILSKSEDVAKLIIDERWQGAEADEEQIEREVLEAAERERREREERDLAEQRERERKVREEQERQERLEREQRERERAEILAARTARRGAGPTVRGTRASTMRGAAARGATGRSSSATTTSGSSSVTGTRRPTSSTSSRPTGIARGVSRRV